MTTETLFKIIRKAIELGLLMEQSTAEDAIRNIERIQELIWYADSVRGEENV